jgi:hypothetical protein
VELALHLEWGRRDNASLYRYFRGRRKEIGKTLGDQTKIGRWGRAGWRRVFEHLPRTDLDEEYANRAASRMAEFIRLLQPMIEASQKTI